MGGAVLSARPRHRQVLVIVVRCGRARAGQGQRRSVELGRGGLAGGGRRLVIADRSLDTVVSRCIFSSFSLVEKLEICQSSSVKINDKQNLELN